MLERQNVETYRMFISIYFMVRFGEPLRERLPHTVRALRQDGDYSSP
jgi:hypothetical protein